MAAKERSERSGNLTALKFQVVRIWNLANLTLEEIFQIHDFQFYYIQILGIWVIGGLHILVHPADSITSNTKNLHTLVTP